ncbi:UDP-N-acetylmuramoyl-L-alanine--D-glutamate ligase [Thalassotalea mangrovi]|uniref:UDP-N-acetylmuramoylalanine--D-glutamate ligase n=1 Tax=Thalassotalea mangrovi TaxID=2572245 RepID=A0A4V5NUS8_9GAMM|nr:UDP-N-acetylmuramoyl-L-alanine--D-glutamate ligase [Thalassotalea mangrovi]TKB47674.1 UDP-N-acetylmuramoyl-L-alanine--D-glutamate ligase [Thalassotalea mangrovi]
MTLTALDFLNNKQVTILGLGATGLSCARFLNRHQITFTILDSRPCVAASAQALALPYCQGVVLGGWDQARLAISDVVIASPGVDIQQPLISESMSEHCQLIGDVELFVRVNQKPIVAITGSNGKSTVVSLLAHLASSCGINAILAGNIGLPVLDIIDHEADVVILELSSFQLETLSTMQAEVGGILNISDDHLDRHKTLENYQQIKQRIYPMSERWVFNRDDDLTWPGDNQGQAISFGLNSPKANQFGLQVDDKVFLAFDGECLLAVDDLPLQGAHNWANCLAALAFGKLLGWPMTAMLTGLQTFKGLDHRCQLIPSADGVRWINDSKATNVGATLAAIEGLADRAERLILIAGGDGKGADFTPLQPILAEKVKTLITLGKDKNSLAALKPGTLVVDSMAQAVARAKAIARPGDMVLLSPACASIDMYPNYMARGEEFATLVKEASYV